MIPTELAVQCQLVTIVKRDGPKLYKNLVGTRFWDGRFD